jgi:hypothetical protein
MDPTIENIILDELLFACVFVLMGIVCFDLGLFISWIWILFI